MSFTTPTRAQRRSAPLAPIIDILFLLLIFFVTTSNFRAQEQQISVALPAAGSAEAAEASENELVVNVEADGTILIGPSEYTPQELRQTLRELVRDYPNERVVIRGDKDAAHGHIVRVMDTVRAAGVRNIIIAAVKRASEVEG